MDEFLKILTEYLGVKRIFVTKLESDPLCFYGSVIAFRNADDNASIVLKFTPSGNLDSVVRYPKQLESVLGTPEILWSCF